MVTDFPMHMINVFSQRLLLILVSGVVVFTVLLLAVAGGWVTYGIYLHLLRFVLLLFALVLMALHLLSFRRRVIQWRSKKNMAYSPQHPSSSDSVAPAMQPEQVLSKEQARAWLDDFLVEQQSDVERNNT